MTVTGPSLHRPRPEGCARLAYRGMTRTRAARQAFGRSILLMLTGVTTACAGASGPASTTTPHRPMQTRAPKATAAPAADATCVAGTESVPVDAAPGAVAAAWRAATATEVPPCTLLDIAHPQVAVTNRSSLDAAEAAAFARAFLRSEHLQIWAAQTDQVNVYGLLGRTEAFDPAVLEFLSAGDPGGPPRSVRETSGCDFPIKVALVTVPGSVAASMTGGAMSGSTVGLVYLYSAPAGCQETFVVGEAASPNPEGSLLPHHQYEGIAVGTVKTDAALGIFFYQDGNESCANPNVAATCGLAGF